MSFHAACRRAGVVAAGTAVAFGALAAPALAHVTVNPEEAEQGSWTKVAFRVPNEDEKAATTKIEVTFPAEHPLRSVKVRPVSGWKADITSEDVDDPEIEKAVTKITWSGGRIEPGEFEEFDVSMGPLPTGVDRLEFPAVQTYSNGDEVAWDQEHKEGAEEPERPAPVLRLTPASGSGHAASGDSGSEPSMSAAPVAATADAADGTARAFGIAGLVVAVVAAGLAAYGLRRSRASG